MTFTIEGLLIAAAWLVGMFLLGFIVGFKQAQK